MKHLVLILDPAHGKDVKGKSSPDGSHKEYLWSREMCKKLEAELTALGYKVFYTSTSEYEIGLTKRKTNANNIAIDKSEIKFLLSLHNNASGADNNWHTATGVEIFTSPGKTLSDYFADYILKALNKEFPNTEVKYRYNLDKFLERDKEAKFTVLMGDYAACLLEWLFQDNKEDVKELKNESTNQRLIKALVEGINYIEDYVSSKLK